MKVIAIAFLIVVCFESSLTCYLGRAMSRRQNNYDRNRAGAADIMNLFSVLNQDEIRYLVDLARSRSRRRPSGDDDVDVGDLDDISRGNSIGRGNGRRGNGDVAPISGRGRPGGQSNGVDGRRGRSDNGIDNSIDRTGNLEDVEGNDGGVGDRRVQQTGGRRQSGQGNNAGNRAGGRGGINRDRVDNSVNRADDGGRPGEVDVDIEGGISDDGRRGR